MTLFKQIIQREMGYIFSPDGGIVYRLVSVDSMPNENDTEN